MRAIVVAGSDLSGALDGDILRTADLLIAADRGAEPVVAAGAVPHVLVGDMDSVAPSVREALAALGAEVVVLSEAKDETDLEMALRLAVERGATEITVYGALGGPRLDHLVATLLLLPAPWLAAADVRLVDPHHEVYLARGHALIPGRPGDTVSLLPVTPVVASVTTSGLAYPLHDEPLFQGTTRGVSNVLSAPEAHVRHGSGVLLVIHYFGRATEGGV